MLTTAKRLTSGHPMPINLDWVVLAVAVLGLALAVASVWHKGVLSPPSNVTALSPLTAPIPSAK